MERMYGVTFERVIVVAAPAAMNTHFIDALITPLFTTSANLAG